jgi:hypothetical protein
MCISNKEMDRAVEMVEAETAYALAHCADNSPDYVASRYAQLHLAYDARVPIRAGANVPDGARLFPPGPNGKRKGTPVVRSAPSQQGIVVALMDASSGQVSDYLVESNGLNGVEVTGVT